MPEMSTFVAASVAADGLNASADGCERGLPRLQVPRPQGAGRHHEEMD